MSKSYSESLSQAETRRVSLWREYSSLLERLKKCWAADEHDMNLIKQLEDEMRPIYRELKEIKNPESLLSPEQRKIIEEADFDTLKKLHRKCHKERVLYGDLVIELEKEIHRKWIKETKFRVDHIYKLDRSLTYRRE